MIGVYFGQWGEKLAQHLHEIGEHIVADDELLLKEATISWRFVSTMSSVFSYRL